MKMGSVYRFCFKYTGPPPPSRGFHLFQSEPGRRLFQPTKTARKSHLVQSKDKRGGLCNPVVDGQHRNAPQIQAAPLGCTGRPAWRESDLRFHRFGSREPDPDSSCRRQRPVQSCVSPSAGVHTPRPSIGHTRPCPQGKRSVQREESKGLMRCRGSEPFSTSSTSFMQLWDFK